MLENENAVLDKIERGNQHHAKDAVKEDYFLRALNVPARLQTAKAPQPHGGAFRVQSALSLSAFRAGSAAPKGSQREMFRPRSVIS
jgi:hypothetical protein